MALMRSCHPKREAWLLSTLLCLLLAMLPNPAPLSGQDGPEPLDRWNRAALSWIDLLKKGDFDEAGSRVDPAVPEGAMDAPHLEALWGQITGQLGSLETVEAGKVDVRDLYHVANLAAGFKAQSVILQVVLTDSLKVSGFFIRPSAPPPYEAPAYVDTASFEEVEVTVGAEPWALPGILTLPIGNGPVPGVVLVHGSGPNDRDETIGASRPFRDLAWGLASGGVAVLRYDKRTKVHGAAFPQDAGLEEEVIEDALGALALLRDRPEVDPGAIFLLGHSLGGMLAPDIAHRDGGLAGVMILASPARPFLDVLRTQIEYVGSLSGPADSVARAQTDSVLDSLDRFEQGTTDPDERLLGVALSYWRELESVDPVASALRLDRPLLVLQGGRDYQATTEDLALWQEALTGRAGATTRLYPSLNHLFAPGEGKATPEEYATEVQHVDARVISDLVSWIHDVAGKGR